MENIYIKLMKHCIGLDHKKPYKRHGRLFYHPYRNYYSTTPNDDAWEVIVASGYATRGDKTQRGGYTYHLTRAGLDWLGNKIGVYSYDEED